MKVTKVLGLAAIGAVLVLIAPGERARALSLASPGPAAAVQEDAKPATTEAGGIIVIIIGAGIIAATGTVGKPNALAQQINRPATNGPVFVSVRKPA